MRRVTLVLGTQFSLTSEVLEQIQRDHNALRVVDASADWTAVAGFRTLPPATGQAWEEASRRLNEHIAEAEIIYCIPNLPGDLRKRAPRLRWIHFGAAGIDRTRGNDILCSDILLTSSGGALAVPIAEWVIMLMLMLVKSARHLEEQQQQKRWERFTVGDLAGKTVGILGLGHIGAATARRCKAFGVRVLATRRSCTQRQAGDEGVADELFPPTLLSPTCCPSATSWCLLCLSPQIRVTFWTNENCAC